jgi:hypothetical protein
LVHAVIARLPIGDEALATGLANIASLRWIALVYHRTLLFHAIVAGLPIGDEALAASFANVTRFRGAALVCGIGKKHEESDKTELP